MTEPSDEEIAAEVESFLDEVQKLEVHESFFLDADQIKVSIGHDLHSDFKFLNITMYAGVPDEDGVVQQFNVALDFEAANKLVNHCIAVGNTLWGDDEDD